MADGASDAIAPFVSTDAFARLDIRAGTVVAAGLFPEARRPAYKLTVDFGEALGTRRSSAQVTDHYACEALVGTRVAAVVNLPPRQIGKFMSEVLVLGFPDAEGRVVLIVPGRGVPNGARLF